MSGYVLRNALWFKVPRSRGAKFRARPYRVRALIEFDASYFLQINCSQNLRRTSSKDLEPNVFVQ